MQALPGLLALFPGLPAAVYCLYVIFTRLFARKGRFGGEVMLIKARILGIRLSGKATVIDVDSGAEDRHVVTVPCVAALFPGREELFAPAKPGRLLLYQRLCYGAILGDEKHFHPESAGEYTGQPLDFALFPAGCLLLAWCLRRIAIDDHSMLTGSGKVEWQQFLPLWLGLSLMWLGLRLVRIKLLKHRLAAGEAMLDRGWQFSPEGKTAEPVEDGDE